MFWQLVAGRCKLSFSAGSQEPKYFCSLLHLSHSKYLAVMVNSVWLSHFLFRSLGSFFIFSQKDLKTVKFLFQCLTRCPSLQFPSSRTFHRIRDWLLWSDKKMHKVLLLLLLLSEYFHLEMKTRLVYAAMRPFLHIFHKDNLAFPFVYQTIDMLVIIMSRIIIFICSICV